MNLDAVCLECGAEAAPAAECPRCGQTVIRRASLLRTSLADVGPAPPAEVEGATRFGDYALLAEVGRGGAGTVHRAWDLENGRLVALKVLRDDSPGVAARFQREVQSATRLSHPGIVKVFRAGKAEGRPYIAMEFVGGRSFAERLDSASRPALRECVRILADICSALRHAHARGVVHRDLKPQNVLVDAEGRAIVVDFGLARPTEPGWTVTMQRETAGTPGYMSPESVRGGAAALDPAVDVYSLGAVLYHVLAGRPPFTGASPYEVMERVSRELPAAPPGPADLAAVAMKCLEKAPGRRYATVAELEEELRAWLDGRGVSATAGSIAGAARRLAWRWRAAAVPLGIVAAGLVAFATWRAVATARDRSESRRILAEASRCEATGQLEESLDRFRRALDLDAGLAEAAAGRDRVAARLRDRSAALEAASRAAESTRRALAILEDARPAVARAVRRLREGQVATEEVERAQAAIGRAMELAPDLAPAHDQLGRLHELLGRDDRAEACWRAAVSKDAAYAPARLHLGRLLVRKGFVASLSFDRSSRDARMATAGEIAREACEVLRGALLQSSSLETPAAADLAAAFLAYTTGDVAEVRRLAQPHLEREEAEEYHWLLGIAAEPGEREGHFTRALGVHANHVPSLHARGQVRRGQGRLREALADFDRAAAVAPELVALGEDRAVLLLMMGRPAEAVAAFDRVLAADPSRATAHLNRGNARLELDDRRGARADYDEAIRLDERFGQAWSNRAILRLTEGDAPGALPDAQRAVEVAPDLAGAFVARGRVYAALDETERAISDFSTAIRLAPNLERARWYRAQLLRKKRLYPEAIADLDEALRLSPGWTEALVERGIAKGQARDHRGALTDFEEVLRREPRHLDARVGRAIAQGELGNRAVAVEELRDVLRDAPPAWMGRARAEMLLQSYERR
jgi:tetratricopeptide (TPR) repeat protein/predicted Ser/Thr protein kinase